MNSPMIFTDEEIDNGRLAKAKQPLNDRDISTLPTTTLPEVQSLVHPAARPLKETGEEEKLFGERGKLYRYDAAYKEWKERGVGEMRILYHSANDTFRFFLRKEKVLKCLLNHQLSADLSVNPMKSLDKAYVWAAINYPDDYRNGESELLSVRFKNVEIANNFIDVVKSCIDMLKVKGSIKGDGSEPEDDVITTIVAQAATTKLQLNDEEISTVLTTLPEVLYVQKTPHPAAR